MTPRRSSGLAVGQLAMVVLFASLTMLFGATLLAFALTRARSADFHGANGPPLPLGLWLSTALVAGVSVALELAVRSARHNRLQALSRSLLAALGLAVAFLATQALNWRALFDGQSQPDQQALYVFTFYMLTGMHALHVFGGLVPLGVLLRSATRRELSSSRYEGLRYAAQYWHFLGGVWLVMLAALHLTS